VGKTYDVPFELKCFSLALAEKVLVTLVYTVTRLSDAQTGN
jgi:hypothetical protein